MQNDLQKIADYFQVYLRQTTGDAQIFARVAIGPERNYIKVGINDDELFHVLSPVSPVMANRWMLLEISSSRLLSSACLVCNLQAVFKKMAEMIFNDRLNVAMHGFTFDLNVLINGE